MDSIIRTALFRDFLRVIQIFKFSRIQSYALSRQIHFSIRATVHRANREKFRLLVTLHRCFFLASRIQ